MRIETYCGKLHFAILDFTFCLLNEITKKIQERNLFYENQILNYARKKLDNFFQTLCLEPALINTYKNETWNTITFKLKQVVKEKQIFQCLG
ncbi:hypothetical protein [Ectobacillus panaciterrae]|uniref:hypothetical protein n=1 Tax=Ectobacillus panaciterrae TaxID=363872 RepID=UPI00048E06EE